MDLQTLKKRVQNLANLIPAVQGYNSAKQIYNSPTVQQGIKYYQDNGGFSGAMERTKAQMPQIKMPTANPIDSANKWLELDKPVLNKTGNPYKDAGIALIDPSLKNIRAGFNLMNVPSYALGGILKESKAQVTGQTPTNMIHPTLSGAIKGVKNKQPIFDELPSAMGVDPNSMTGMAIGLTGELLTPDPTDVRLLGKVGKLEDVVERSSIISKIKNIADDSGTLGKFKKTVGQSQEALDAMKVAGFPDMETFWKYTHSGYNKVNNLMSESLAQTKYRLSQMSTKEKTVNFVSDMKKEFKTSDGAFKNLPTGQKVQLWDYIRTPDRVLEKLGLKNEAKLLRDSWDKYLDELPVEINKITEWSKAVPRKESNQLIFKYLDGQIAPNVLEPQELKVATEIKDYLSKWADKLKLPKESRITNYITRIFDNETGGVGFPDEISAIIRDKVAGSVYDPFVKKRLGKMGYIEDTWRALDAYVKRATRKVNMDNALKMVKDRSAGFDEKSFDYIKSYIDRVNLRPTKIDTLIDDSIKSVVGYKYGDRPVTSSTKKTRQMVYRGLLGLNPASALKNLSQGANTYAELGEKYTVIGYYKMIRELPKYIRGMDTELEKVGVLKNGFIEDRTLNATRKFWEKADSVLFYMFNLAEKVNRGSAYYGAKAKALNKGMKYADAVEYAKDIVRKTQFTFGAIDTPVAMQSDLVKTFTQFMSYSVKQGEFLTEKIIKKDIAGLIRYIGASLLFINTIGDALGMKWSDMIPSVRLGVPPTMQGALGAYQVASGAKDEWGQEPDPNILKRAWENKNLRKGVTAYIPAGNQIFNKTIPAMVDYSRGESRTPSGGMRFPIEQNTENFVKGALLGKYASDEAKEYYNNDRTPLSEKQAEVVRASNDKKSEYQKFMDFRKTNAQLDDAKEAVKKSGNAMAVNDKYVYLNEETGEVNTISLNFDIPEPKLTKTESLNKELIKSYKSKITTAKGNVKKLYELGVLTEDEASKLLDSLDVQYKKASGGTKAKKITLKAPTLKKLPEIKLSQSSPKTLTSMAQLLAKQASKRPDLKFKKPTKIYAV